MNHSIRTIAATALLASLPLLGACESKTPDQQVQKVKEESLISQATREAVAEARKEINEGNISVSNDHKSGQGKAEITPKGDLLIDGRAVAINQEQRKLLLEYRGHVASVAEAGVEIGMQGADLATKAVGAALKGVFTGNTEDVEKHVEAEASKIKASALKLCDRLPAMMASQQKLKTAVPEFAPYATMDQSDIDECRDDAKEDKGGKHENFAAKAAAAESAKQ